MGVVGLMWALGLRASGLGGAAASMRDGDIIIQELQRTRKPKADLT